MEVQDSMHVLMNHAGLLRDVGPAEMDYRTFELIP